MHTFPLCTCVACVLGSVRASLLKFWDQKRAWPTLPDCATTPEPPQRCVQLLHPCPLPDRP
eukprot:5307927-Pleurochrysis_carterae.AAC.1